MCPLPDKDSGSTYGALGKVDYQNLPPADQSTDWSNPLLAPAICNVAALTLVSERFNIQLVLNAADGYIVTNNWNAVWANVTTTAPVVHHVSTGIYTITVPAVVSDEYNYSVGIIDNHTVNFSKGWANIENPGGLASVHVSASANVITFTLYDHTNALNDFSGVTVDVFGAY